MKTIGFIGLGIMGKPMALNLLKAGYTLQVYDINAEAVEAVINAGENGRITGTPASREAIAADSPQAAAEGADLILTMLPNTRHVREVILGERGVIKGAKAGAVVIDMSSISPVASKEIAGDLAAVGVEMLDAPVSGGEPKAIDASLAIMVGGRSEVFERVKDVLSCMGGTVTLVGGHGSGTMTKLANQIMVNLNIAAMSEALVLAAKAGIDIHKLYEAVRGGLAGSAVLDAKLPLILERNFVAGGRIDINLKDIANVMETAHEMDVPLPLSAQLLEIMHALKTDGKATDDHGGIVQFYEKLAHVEVKSEGLSSRR